MLFRTGPLVNEILCLTMDRSGDEIQGIKRGVLEIADRIVVTKNDLNEEGARKTNTLLKQSMKAQYTGGQGVVFYRVSAVIRESLTALFADLMEIVARPLSNVQTLFWLEKGWNESVNRFVKSDTRLQEMYHRTLAEVKAGDIDHWSAIEKLKKELEELWRRYTRDVLDWPIRCTKKIVEYQGEKRRHSRGSVEYFQRRDSAIFCTEIGQTCLP